jgi:hypothetical protein
MAAPNLKIDYIFGVGELFTIHYSLFPTSSF